MLFRQGPHFGFDHEQLADEVIQVRRQCQQQFRLILGGQGLSTGACRQQPAMHCRIRLFKFVQEYLIQTHQTVTAVKIVERKSEFQGCGSGHDVPVGGQK